MNQSRTRSAAVAKAARSAALNVVPLRSMAHTTSRVERTKPNSPAGGLSAADLAILREAMECTRDDFPHDSARSTALSGAQLRSAAPTANATQRTKPNPRDPLPLTPRQLAAARLLVQGVRPSEVARQLVTIPQTISRWKRLPAFVEELKTLHAMLCLHAREIPNHKHQITNNLQIQMTEIQNRSTRTRFEF